MNGDNNNAEFWPTLADVKRGFHTTHARHIDIHHDDIELTFQCPALLYCLLATAGFSDNINALLTIDQALDTVAHQIMLRMVPSRI